MPILHERGAEVVMMSPYGAYGPRIEAAGFHWSPLPMDRRSLNLVGELTLLERILEAFRSEQPDAIHNFTIKCVVYGSLAARWLGIGRRINAVTGLGHIFINDSPRAKLLRAPVKALPRLALGGSESRLILQGSDDVRLFPELGLVADERIRLIRSSGVDTIRFAPFARDREGPFRVLLTAHLLWEKGIREYVGAAEYLGLRTRGVEFLLAGVSDQGNPSAVPEEDIARWDETGVVEMLGHVDDMTQLMRTVDLVVFAELPGGCPQGIDRGSGDGVACYHHGCTRVPGGRGR